MLRDKARYVREKGRNISPLEKIGDFMILEAEAASEAGIIGLHIASKVQVNLKVIKILDRRIKRLF